MTDIVVKDSPELYYHSVVGIKITRISAGPPIDYPSETFYVRDDEINGEQKIVTELKKINQPPPKWCNAILFLRSNTLYYKESLYDEKEPRTNFANKD